jgi:hypothetical protein
VIDWTKPIELINRTADGSPLQVRVERVLENGSAIVSWPSTHDGTLAVAVYGPDSPPLRNVPPKPREWWIRMSGPVTAIVSSVPLAAGVHVREVLPE